MFQMRALRVMVNPLLHIRACETLACNLLSGVAAPRQIERRISLGDEYPDITFYVIRRSNYWGLMSVYVMYLRYIDYALRRGWVPVVDMQTVPNLYNGKSHNSSYNAWESFFEQPCGYGLQDIRYAKNIVLSSQSLILPDDYYIDIRCLQSENTLWKWRQIARRYISYSDEARRYIDYARNSVYPPDRMRKRILGVYCRGTDYLKMKPKRHAVQPSPSMVIEKAHEVVNLRGYDYVYLVTEDEDILNSFKISFGDALLYLSAKRYQLADGYIWNSREMLERPATQNGLEYLASIVLLSECDAFIGGVTGGTAALMLMRQEPFAYDYLWDLGRY